MLKLPFRTGRILSVFIGFNKYFYSENTRSIFIIHYSEDVDVQGPGAVYLIRTMCKTGLLPNICLCFQLPCSSELWHRSLSLWLTTPQLMLAQFCSLSLISNYFPIPAASTSRIPSVAHSSFVPATVLIEALRC